MDRSLQLELQTSVRSEKTATMNASDGLTSDIVDLGRGKSAVCIQIETALAAGTILTFKGKAGEADSAVAGDMDEVRNHVSDGSTAASSYSFVPADSVGVFPLDVGVFNGIRHLQIVSSEDNSSAEIKIISKPV